MELKPKKRNMTKGRWDGDTEEVKKREIMWLCCSMVMCRRFGAHWSLAVSLTLCWWCECVLSQVRQHFLLGQAWVYLPRVLLVAVFHNVTFSPASQTHTHLQTHSGQRHTSRFWRLSESLQALPSFCKQTTEMPLQTHFDLSHPSVHLEQRHID